MKYPRPKMIDEKDVYIVIKKDGKAEIVKSVHYVIRAFQFMTPWGEYYTPSQDEQDRLWNIFTDRLGTSEEAMLSTWSGKLNWIESIEPKSDDDDGWVVMERREPTLEEMNDKRIYIWKETADGDTEIVREPQREGGY